MEDFTNYNIESAVPNEKGLESQPVIPASALPYFPFMKSLTSWATFKAIMDIITGAVACLGFILIVPAVYGVFQILAGVKLLNCVDELKKYSETNDIPKLELAMEKLNKFFKFTGITLIVQIAFAIIMIIAYIILFAWLIQNGSTLLENFDLGGY